MDTHAEERWLVLRGEHVLGVRGAALTERLRERWRLAEAPGGAARVLCTLEATPGAAAAPIAYPAGRSGFVGDATCAGAVRVDLASFVPGCRVPVDPDVDPDTLLRWLNVLLPATGMLPLHASGFCVEGAGVAVTGFAHSGKTGVLLAAAEAGMPVIGDECLWLTPDGGLRGLDANAEVRLRYLDELPVFRRRLPAAALRRARLARGLARLARGFSPRLGERLEDRARVSVASARLFPVRTGPVALSDLFLSIPHASAACAAVTISGEEGRRRLLEVLRAELKPVLERYAHHRYLFPGRRNDWLDGAEARLEQRVEASLAGVRCHVLRHPQPASPREMFDVVRRSLG